MGEMAIDVALKRFLSVLGTGHRLSGREFLLVKRWKATAAPTIATSSTTSADDAEWTHAKPFDEMVNKV